MANIPIPPTFTPLLIVNQASGQSQLNPIWFKWFLDFSGSIETIISVLNATFSSLSGTPPFPFGTESSGDNDGFGFPGQPGAPGAQGAAGQMMLAEQSEASESIMLLAPSVYNTPSSPVRALDATYTNVSTSTLLVHLTIRCAIALAGGNAYAQALMDTATPPTVAASGLIGIQTGLLGEDNAFQLLFLVNPGGTYKVLTSTTNGTVTLGTWFEFPL